MFGLSTTEILLILAVALIFVGPGELPKVARTIGKGVAQVRGAMGKVDSEMRRAMREAASELDDEGKPVAVDSKTPPHDSAAPGEAPDLKVDPHHTPPHAARDWSQVGKTPVAGQVAKSPAAKPTDDPVPPPSAPSA